MTKPIYPNSVTAAIVAWSEAVEIDEYLGHFTDYDDPEFKATCGWSEYDITWLDSLLGRHGAKLEADKIGLRVVARSAS